MAEGRIPDDLVQKVQDESDIVEVISEHFQLKKTGRNFKALCPFHSEKTPSFVVNPDKQIFHCFGCGVGGNVFSFLMKHSHMAFVEAVRFLAEKKGIKIPKALFVSPQTSDLTKNLLRVNESAVLYFQQFLKQTREGQIALAYLEKRKISKETIDKMRLGYAPLKGDALCLAASKKQISLSLLEKAGLIMQRRGEDGYYDYFRKRIIFPVCNAAGRVVGFGGRVLDDTQPKYLNSPETPVYSKSRVLYGFDLARESIQKSNRAFVVEGYFDFISLYQAGITNAVASSGTSLTDGQVRLLKRAAGEVILVYDPDTAGTAATLRGIELLLHHQVKVRIISLQEGLDPDEFIKKKGKDSFLKAGDEAPGFFDYNLERLLKHHHSGSLRDKLAIVEEMLPWIKLVENSIERSAMVKQISERLEINETDVIEEFNKLTSRGKSSPEYSKEKVSEHILDAEGSLIKLILDNGQIFAEIKKEINPEDFCDNNLRQIAELLWRHSQSSELPSAQSLVNFLPEEKIRDIFSFLLFKKIVFHNETKAIKDCISNIKKRKRFKRQKELEKEIKLAEVKGEEVAIKKLLLEYQTLVKAN